MSVFSWNKKIKNSAKHNSFLNNVTSHRDFWFIPDFDGTADVKSSVNKSRKNDFADSRDYLISRCLPVTSFCVCVDDK